MRNCPSCGSASRQLLNGGWWRCLGDVFAGTSSTLIGMSGSTPIFSEEPMYVNCDTIYIAHDPLMTVL